MCCRDEPSDDDGIKTITYDEYVNAGIPDALLQGLGFAESLSKEPVDNEDVDDARKNETEGPVVGVSGGEVQPGPSVAAPVSVVPAASLIEMLSSRIAEAVMSGNSSKLSPSLSTASAANIVSSTPSALTIVDRQGNILPPLPSLLTEVGNACNVLPNLPSIPTPVGNAVNILPTLTTVPTAVSKASASSLIALSDAGKAMKYVDQNGRVITGLPLQASTADNSSSSRLVRVVDSNGRIITKQVPPNMQIVDRDGRVITADVSLLPEDRGISQAGETETDVGNFQMLSSAGVGAQSSLKRNESDTRGCSAEQDSIPKSW